MANTELVTLIIQLTGSYITYLLPVIGVMAGIVFLFTFLMAVTIGLPGRIFK